MKTAGHEAPECAEICTWIKVFEAGNRTDMNARTNRLLLAAAVLFATLTGCVRVEMPDHMVSDAVDAGKDLYRSVERAFTKDPKIDEVESNSNGSEFRLAKSGSADVSVGELKRSCMDTLLAGTREKVGRDDFEYKIIDNRVEAKDSGVFVVCQIAVARPKAVAAKPAEG